MQDPHQRRPNRFTRFIYIFAPFLLLLAAVVALNWEALTTRSPIATTAGVTTAVVQQPVRPDSSATLAATSAAATAVDPPQPTATAVPLPTIAPDAIIQLVGPPQDSLFAEDTAVAFYWNWSLELPDTTEFMLTITSTDTQIDLPVGSDPNLGLGYRVTLPPGTLSPGEYSWTVRLIAVDGSEVLRESETRPFTIIPAVES